MSKRDLTSWIFHILHLTLLMLSHLKRVVDIPGEFLRWILHLRLSLPDSGADDIRPQRGRDELMGSPNNAQKGA